MLNKTDADYGTVVPGTRTVQIKLFSKGNIEDEKFTDSTHAAIVHASNPTPYHGSGVANSIFTKMENLPNSLWGKKRVICNNPLDYRGALIEMFIGHCAVHNITPDNNWKIPYGDATISLSGWPLNSADILYRYVIHAVGPTNKDPNALRSAYVKSLAIAESNGITHLTFPTISTGQFGYHMFDATPVAVRALCDYLLFCNHNIQEVRLIIWGSYKKSDTQKTGISVYQEEFKKMAALNKRGVFTLNDQTNPTVVTIKK